MTDYDTDFFPDPEEEPDQPLTDDEAVDEYSPNLVSTRGVDDESVFAATEQFRNTPLMALAQSAATLAAAYGPSDPMLADLAGEILSELTTMVTTIRSSPIEFVMDICRSSPQALDQLRRYLQTVGGGEQ